MTRRCTVVDLTEEEVKAIASLRRLAKKWPQSLELFGWSGELHVLKHIPGDMHRIGGTSVSQQRQKSVATISGIHCDGGDPSSDEVVQKGDEEE